jgi:hypothetical protein
MCLNFRNVFIESLYIFITKYNYPINIDTKSKFVNFLLAIILMEESDCLAVKPARPLRPKVFSSLRSLRNLQYFLTRLLIV